MTAKTLSGPPKLTDAPRRERTTRTNETAVSAPAVELTGSHQRRGAVPAVNGIDPTAH
jgi:hypothetical protein